MGVVTVLWCYGMVHVTEASGGCGYCIAVLWYGACDYEARSGGCGYCIVVLWYGACTMRQVVGVVTVLRFYDIVHVL